MRGGRLREVVAKGGSTVIYKMVSVLRLTCTVFARLNARPRLNAGLV